MQRIRVDLHVHSSRSRDSTLAPAELVERARAAGLDRVAITDHNRLDGAFEASDLDPALVIIGEEIDCAGGADLIGLYLREPIPPGLSVEETADRIRDQGGLVYAPHPFAYLKDARARARRVLAVADIVEVHNARAFLRPWNRRARQAARAAGLPCAAGTDAHFGHEIGGAFTELPPFDDAAGLRAVLAHAHPVSVRMPVPLVHVASITVQLGKRLAGTSARRPTGPTDRHAAAYSCP
jgi:predicted metal-dependent phosphoesterase TrpH